jgi:methoxymalonate biosynthesis acyl carrier protein
MAEPSALEARIRLLFRDKLKLDVPSVDTDLFETAALDSMVFVDLLLHLEREFGATVALEDIEFDHFRSIARIAEFVANRVAWAEGTAPLARSEPVHRGRPEGVT